jgi:hypothetical protein
VIDHDPQIGDLSCKPGHTFEMARQNADIIEDETSRGQNPQPVQNLVANDPGSTFTRCRTPTKARSPMSASSAFSISTGRSSGSQPTTPAIQA